MKERIKKMSIRATMCWLAVMWIGVVGNWIALALSNYTAYWLFVAVCVVGLTMVIAKVVKKLKRFARR